MSHYCQLSVQPTFILTLFFAYFLQVASESEHCLIKREHEKCMESIMLHNPSEDLDLGKRACGHRYAHPSNLARKHRLSRLCCGSFIVFVSGRSENTRRRRWKHLHKEMTKTGSVFFFFLSNHFLGHVGKKECSFLTCSHYSPSPWQGAIRDRPSGDTQWTNQMSACNVTLSRFLLSNILFLKTQETWCVIPGGNYFLGYGSQISLATTADLLLLQSSPTDCISQSAPWLTASTLKENTPSIKDLKKQDNKLEVEILLVFHPQILKVSQSPFCLRSLFSRFYLRFCF